MSRNSNAGFPAGAGKKNQYLAYAAGFLKRRFIVCSYPQIRYAVVNELCVLGEVKIPKTIFFRPFSFCDFLSIGELP